VDRYHSLDHRKLEFPAFRRQRAGSAVGVYQGCRGVVGIIRWDSGRLSGPLLAGTFLRCGQFHRHSFADRRLHRGTGCDLPILSALRPHDFDGSGAVAIRQADRSCAGMIAVFKKVECRVFDYRPAETARIRRRRSTRYATIEK